jgi:uncharacterized membrane protein YfcA
MMPGAMDATLMYVVGVICLATLVRSTLGFGEALVAVPLLALRTPVTVAAPLAVLVSVVVAGAIVAQDWRHIQFRSARWLTLSALCGIPLGLLLLTRVDEQVVKMLLGAIVAGFAAYSLAANSRLHLQKDHRLWLLLSGFFSGVLGGAYGMNGPPLAIYGALRRWSPQHFRATLQGYFLPVSLAGMIGYAWIGLWSSAVTRYFLVSLPGIVAAVLIGRVVNAQLRGQSFFRIVYVGLIITGLTLLVQAMVHW